MHTKLKLACSCTTAVYILTLGWRYLFEGFAFVKAFEAVFCVEILQATRHSEAALHQVDSL